MPIDGHEVGIGSTIVGALYLVHRTLPKGWVRGYIHRQPVAALASFWALLGFALPLTVPPIRRALKLPTNQYNAEHPNAVIPKSKLYD
jgi:hypothetical protein